MDQTILWGIIIVLAGIILGYLIYKGVKIIKASPEEKKKVIITYLIGLVTLAEKAIGAGHGDLKLKQVEDWFNKKAPVAYKLMLKLLGKENLKELIEAALKEIKENFAK